MSDPFRVTDLIGAAQRHLEQYGDSPVNVVLVHPDDAVDIGLVTRTGYDRYSDDGSSEFVFEIEANVDDE
jgi:hypothetical protein